MKKNQKEIRKVEDANSSQNRNEKAFAPLWSQKHWQIPKSLNIKNMAERL